ncbi:MAG: hypothetical protein E1N59_3074 [Puniceicoccaceae bacterium 5H]|nr:MAG: hypothetical protein E1N59_3074 [Puniceicoccaceae bacterium 5H]
MPDPSQPSDEQPKRRLVLRRPPEASGDTPPPKQPEPQAEPPLFREEEPPSTRRSLKLKRDLPEAAPPAPAQMPDLTPEEEALLSGDTHTTAKPTAEPPPEVDLFRMQAEASASSSEELEQQLQDNPLRAEAGDLPPLPTADAPVELGQKPQGGKQAAPGTPPQKVQLKKAVFDTRDAEMGAEDELSTDAADIFGGDASPKKKGKTKKAKAKPEKQPADAKQKKAAPSPLLLVLLLVVIGGGAYWWFFMRSGPELASVSAPATPSRTPAPRPSPAPSPEAEAPETAPDVAAKPVQAATQPSVEGVAYPETLESLQALLLDCQWLAADPARVSLQGVVYGEGSYLTSDRRWRITTLDAATHSITLEGADGTPLTLQTP